jgi:hypothetical protein
LGAGAHFWHRLDGPCHDPTWEPRPENITPPDGPYSCLPKRFIFYKPLEENKQPNGRPRIKKINITHAVDPADHLDLLRMNKRWYYLGVHVFYASNTFAFSSLGEFGHFTKGIGEARLQRIQSVSMLWVGSQKLTQQGG